MLIKFLKVVSAILSLVMVLTTVFVPSISKEVDYLGSVEEIADGVYAVDYTLDYDVDEMLENGVNTTVELILKGFVKVLTGNTGNFGCTTFNAKTPDGNYIFARNYDYTQSNPLIVWTHPDNGYASIGLIDLELIGYAQDLCPLDEFSSLMTLLAPYTCVDGMNEKGLSIGVLEIENEPTFQLTEKKNLTTTTMIRAVLDKAATLDEAIKIFESYDMHDFLLGECTYHYQIADAKGNSAVIEYVDGKMNVIYPESKIDCCFEYLTAANYLLTSGASDPDGFGQDRTDIVKKALNSKRGTVTEQQAMDILKSVSVTEQDWDGYICYTLWSCVYNNNSGLVTICANRDYDNPIKLSVTDPKTIIK